MHQRNRNAEASRFVPHREGVRTMGYQTIAFERHPQPQILMAMSSRPLHLARPELRLRVTNINRHHHSLVFRQRQRLDRPHYSVLKYGF